MTELTKEFEHAGKRYEVRVWKDGRDWRVRCYCDDLPLGFLYSVTPEVDSDFHVYHGQRAVEQLVALAEQSCRGTVSAPAV